MKSVGRPSPEIGSWSSLEKGKVGQCEKMGGVGRRTERSESFKHVETVEAACWARVTPGPISLHKSLRLAEQSLLARYG